MWSVIGWIAWAVAAYLALTFAYGCRKYAAAGQGFQWATGVQTFFWWVISVVFLVAPLNKLHIIWLLPVGFLSGSFIALGGIPILSPVVLLLTRMFLALVLVGVKRGYEVGGGVDKNALIRDLVRLRIRNYPLATAKGFDEGMLESMSSVLLLGFPEGTIVAIVETWATMSKMRVPDVEIFTRIENHRSRLSPRGELPTPLNLTNATVQVVPSRLR